MGPRPRTSALSFLRNMRADDIAAYLTVFLVCFCSAKFGQYLFYTADTSPAVIWPPFGIALGAMFLGGYRMWFPVALAELFASSSSGIVGLPVILAATIGQTLQPLLAAWAMNSLGFDGKLRHLRDAFILIGGALIATMIAPSITTLTQALTHTLTSNPGLVWSRSWAGGILSVLVFTPLMTTWTPLQKIIVNRFEQMEMALAFFSLVLIDIFLFWTPYAQNFGISGIYVLLAVLVWISLRMEPRFVTLALLLTTTLGMAGTIIAHPTATPINQQLLADELVIEFLAIIFLLFAAVVEERRSARRALEQNIAELERALEKISREDVAKNEFIATLAHELRNPLAPVVSTLELLKLQTRSASSRELIESAENQLGMMRRLLDDLLDVARVSRNAFTLQKERVDLQATIARCVDTARHFIQERGQSFVVLPVESGITIEADPVRLQQIVLNLLHNASKYTQKAGTIELSCKINGTNAEVRVRDNGIGIPKGSLLEIFEPFRQVRATTRAGTGLGIGLWLTKRLVAMHAGSIKAESDGPGYGSSFTVCFPLAKEVPLPSKEKTKASEQALSPRRVLIIDDNEAAATGLKKLLAFKGHEVEAAYTGRSGIEMARTFLPQVILLDIGLPDLDGYAVAQQLRALGLPYTLIALSGYGQEEDKARARQAGFDQHLTKPVGIAEIEAILAAQS
jgi:signal transduction histidine kinase